MCEHVCASRAQCVCVACVGVSVTSLFYLGVPSAHKPLFALMVENDPANSGASVTLGSKLGLLEIFLPRPRALPPPFPSFSASHLPSAPPLCPVPGSACFSPSATVFLPRPGLPIGLPSARLRAGACASGPWTCAVRHLCQCALWSCTRARGPQLPPVLPSFCPGRGSSRLRPHCPPLGGRV